jgi:lipoprotein-anchoring transpeptidase ErfK/SrfK
LAMVPAVLAAMFSTMASAQQQTAPQQAQQTLQPAAPQRIIVVSLEDRKLALVEDGQVKKIYTVAVGKPSSPSPEGVFTIERRVANPTYRHDGKTVLPGPANPVGTRWMGLNKHGYGIHGTNEPKSIGKAASHGCIRMARPDLEEFYALVSVGDTVRLVGQRNDETARLFGSDASTSQTVAATATPPIQIPKTEAATAIQESAPAAALNQVSAVSAAAISGTR